jgi:hypothetical protein
MNICFLPIEVLVEVFVTIYEGYPIRESLYTLAALARTCRTFKEPALNALWKNMNGFKPLILCLPEGVVGRTPGPRGRLVS